MIINIPNRLILSVALLVSCSAASPNKAVVGTTGPVAKNYNTENVVYEDKDSRVHYFSNHEGHCYILKQRQIPLTSLDGETETPVSISCF